jgi:DNA-directed RNA polymerase subunit K/omega
MEIFTPMETARHAGTKYRSILVAARFARQVNELPRDRLLQVEGEDRPKKLTTLALQKLTTGALNFRELRRRRAGA